MTDLEHLLSEALGLYALQQPQAELIRHNENMTYKITDADKKYVLRIHKRVKGFTLDVFNMSYKPIELVQSEIDIISALKNGTDLSMQTPVHGKNGSVVQTLADGTPVTLLEWVEGQTVKQIGMTPEIANSCGRLIAEIHTFFSKQMQNDKLYMRYTYDQTILPQIAERIESAAQITSISREQAKIILRALDEMRFRFDELNSISQKHIIHGDFGKDNIIVGADGRLTPIDFGLCGYSHFYMDIGDIFDVFRLKNNENRKQIVEGYKSVRKCDINSRYIELYFAFGATFFIACQYARAKERDWFPSEVERWCCDIFQPLADNKEFILM